ncbi:MAG: 30S ribosomal protein S5 [bacterium]|nr:30S ribosomal protein S5 [bacterium]
MFDKPARKKFGRGEEKKEFDQFVLDLARVTRVTQGGKHMSFRACVIIGDRKGRVGYGLAKGKDVQLGVEKAVRQAKKNIITVPIVNETIPHIVYQKFNAAYVMLKPAPKGSGIIAGGAVRAVLDLAGIPNVSSKILGKTKNKVSITKATFGALSQFKKLKSMAKTTIKPADIVVNSPEIEVKEDEKVGKIVSKMPIKDVKELE